MSRKSATFEPYLPSKGPTAVNSLNAIGSLVELQIIFLSYLATDLCLYEPLNKPHTISEVASARDDVPS